MKLKLLWIGVVAASVLLLAGCQVNLATEVKSDGSGKLLSEIGLTPEEADALAEMAGGETKTLCADLQSASSQEMPPEVKFTQEQRGDEAWCIASQPFADLDELRKLYADMQGVTINQLEIAEGKFVYDVSVDMGGEAASAVPLAFEWRLTVPGAAGDNNADSVEGRTLIWQLKPGRAADLHAESSVGFSFGELPAWTWIAALALCCLCLMGLAVIGLIVFLVLRRSKPASPVAEASP